MFPGGGKVDNLELAAKLNNYVARAIKYYDQYAATFFDPLSKKDNIPSEYEREYFIFWSFLFDGSSKFCNILNSIDHFFKNIFV